MADGTSRFTTPRRINPKNRKGKLPRRTDFFRTQYYFTKGHEHLGEARNVNEEQSPFLHPPCSLMFSYFQYWKQKKRTQDKEQRMDSSNVKLGHELLRSLRVDVEIEALEAKKHKEPEEAIAMTDIDPDYFTELAGRPVKEKFSLREYVEDTRDIFRTRLLAGQELDDCIRIDQQFVEEQKILDRIKHHYHRYVTGFEAFLSKDHEDSMKVLVQAEAEVEITNDVTVTRNQLSKDFGRVRLELYHWEENWRMVKMCQRFLYRVSPVAWRVEHDWIYRSESGENISSASTNDLFGRYRLADDSASLEVLIDLFEQDIAEAGPADMYFEDPLDLVRVFRTIATQNLNALIHLESLARPMAEMTTMIETAEDHIKSRVEELTTAINELQAAIDKLEARAEELEKYANTLLEGVFRDSVCSEEVLRFQVFIEDAYEICVGPNDANLDSFSMMKWIEKTHEDLNMVLDTLPPEVVQACEVEGFRQERKAMKDTEEAAKKFELMHRLLAALKRIMEPPMTKRRPLMSRSPPAVRRVKPTPPPPPLTDDEMQYMNFFTTYCKQEDFTAYLAQLPDDVDLSLQPSRRRSTPENDETTPDNEDAATSSSSDG